MNGTAFVIEKLGLALAQAEAMITEQAAEIERLRNGAYENREAAAPPGE